MELLDGSLAMHLVIGSFSRSPLRHMQHAERCTRHRVARDIGERGAELHDCPERVCFHQANGDRSISSLCPWFFSFFFSFPR